MIQTKEKTGYDTRISHLDLDLTTDCLLNCTYCFRGHKKPRYLSYEVATRAIDFLIDESKNIPDLMINLFGGEPLMAFDVIKKIVVYAERKASYYGKRIAFGATTNMVLINDEIFDFFRRHRIYFHTSIDGAPESHDKHRIFPDGSGSSEVAFKNIPRILSYQNHTTARVTVSNDTAYRMYDDLVYLHKTLGYKNIAMIQVPEQEWDSNQIDDLKRELRKISDYYIDCFVNNEILFIKHIDDSIRSLVNPRRRKNHCGAGRRSIAVSLDGELYPCHRFTTSDPEKVWKLGDIWKGIEHSKRKQLIDLDCRYDTQADCENCLGVNSCGIGCIAVNWATSENIYKPHPNWCFFNELYFREAMRIHYILTRENNELFKKIFYGKNDIKADDEITSCNCVTDEVPVIEDQNVHLADKT